MFQGLNYRYQQSLADCYNGAATSPTCYALENKYGNDGTNANNGDAAIGGPVYIPKLINGRNKFFFFFSGIIDNFAGVGPASATVPTEQEIGGNFSDFPTLPRRPPGLFPAPPAVEACAGYLSNRDALLRPVPDLQSLLGHARFKGHSPPHAVLRQSNTQPIAGQ